MLDDTAANLPFIRTVYSYWLSDKCANNCVAVKHRYPDLQLSDLLFEGEHLMYHWFKHISERLSEFGQAVLSSASWFLRGSVVYIQSTFVIGHDKDICRP